MTDRLALTDETALGRYRARVMAQIMADEALALSLWQAVEPDRFVELVLRSAGTHRIDLDAETVRHEIRPDPLGLARFAPAPPSGSAWPSRHWLPVNVMAQASTAAIDWAYFGSEPLAEPFFEDLIRRVLRHPFNRLFRYRMTLADFLDGARRQQSHAPAGFIFHMSRCGSTLVAQMLAALARNTVVSEAAPIDAAVQLARARRDLPPQRHSELLRAMIAAFGRRRGGDDGHTFIKLDCWHVLALPLFRCAYPAVPWVFLYRDPVEVLVSQMRQRGTQMVPELVPPGLYGIDDFDGVPGEEYCARVLSKICGAAVAHYGNGGGLMVNYRELPGAMATRILPHFGVAVSQAECDAMMLAARQDAKAPAIKFADDAEAKQRAATDLIRALAERLLGEVYARLEALRSSDA